MRQRTAIMAWLTSISTLLVIAGCTGPLNQPKEKGPEHNPTGSRDYYFRPYYGDRGIYRPYIGEVAIALSIVEKVACAFCEGTGWVVNRTPENSSGELCMFCFARGVNDPRFR